MFTFGGASYRNSRDMHDVIAQDWLSAAGSNDRGDMLHILGDYSDQELVDQAALGWALANNRDFDREELAAAFKRCRDNFSMIFGERA